MIRREPYKGESTLQGGQRHRAPIYGCVPPTASSGWPIPYRSPFRNNSQTNWPNQTTRRVFRWSLWFSSLTKDSNFLIISNQSWVLIQCVAYLGMTGMSRWFFLGSRNPRKVEGEQQCGRTGSSETMASQPHYPLLACSVTVQLQNVFLQEAKYICPNFKVYLSKMQNVFVQMVAVKQWLWTAIAPRCWLAVSPYNCPVTKWLPCC